MRTSAQLVLDSAHFFPLDDNPEVPPLLLRRVRRLEAEGMVADERELMGAKGETSWLGRMDSPTKAGNKGCQVPQGAGEAGSLVAEGCCGLVIAVEVVSQVAAQMVAAAGDSPGQLVGCAGRSSVVELRSGEGSEVDGSLVWPICLSAGAERLAGRKWKDGRIDEWAPRKAKSPREWRLRKECEIDGLAGCKRRRKKVPEVDRRRRQRRRGDGGWAPGVDAEPPD